MLVSAVEKGKTQVRYSCNKECNVLGGRNILAEGERDLDHWSHCCNKQGQ